MRRVLYILGHLDDQDIEWMVTAGRQQQMPAGYVLIREGAPLDALYIVLDGLLSVTASALNGKEIARLGAGDVVGEMSFVDARPPSATVTVMVDAIVLGIERALLTTRLEQDNGFAGRFYRAVAVFLSHRLRNTVSRLGYGGEREMDEAVEYQDELDFNVLDNVHLAGARFDRMLKRLLSDGG